jgi:hypothetical protein
LEHRQSIQTSQFTLSLLIKKKFHFFERILLPVLGFVPGSSGSWVRHSTTELWILTWKVIKVESLYMSFFQICELGPTKGIFE